MTWQAYFMTGPPSRYIPFNFLARLFQWVLLSKSKSEAVAEGLIRRMLFSQLTESERERYHSWRDVRGMMEGQYEKELAANMVRSTERTWDGFLDIPMVYHSGWGGVDPSAAANLKDYQGVASPPPVYLISASRDHIVSHRVAEWLANAYINSSLRVIDGSHLSIMFYLEELWKEILL